MQSTLGHLTFGIADHNRGFYRDLFRFLGWKVLYDMEGMLAVSDAHDVSFWFGSQIKPVANDYDGPGLNHFGIHTSRQADVDAAAAYLAERGVAPLFKTPRHRPDFAADEQSTYYQIMFETPDRILVEIVYIGPKE